MCKYFFFIITFISIYLSAEQSIIPYVTSENDTLSLVEGIVNAYNGKLVQVDRDIEIQGTEPFELIRYYDGGHHFVSRYGYGVGFSLPLQLMFDPNSKKQNVIVEQRGGSKLLFNASKQKNKRFAGKIEPEQLRSGYTNCCESLLRGDTDISAMTVDGTESEFVVDLGNGTKRHYQYFYLDESGIRYYRLMMEERPNGNRRHFAYMTTSSISPKRIWTTNKSGSLTLNWIAFNYDGNNKNYKIIASNGQQAHYQLEQKKGTAKWENKDFGYKIKYSTPLLAGVTGEHLTAVHYDPLLRTHCKGSLFSTTKVRKPDGRSLNIEYDKNERVRLLTLSGIDAAFYNFNYQKDHTVVTDALGNTKRFDFTKRRLTKLTEPHRVQHYSWNENGQLISHAVKDPFGKDVSRKKYSYDLIGNIVETKLEGNITCKGSKDCYVVRYKYSQDGRNNLICENHNEGIEFLFTYAPETNLVVSKLTFNDQCIVEREFNLYDQNGILLQKITDDGSTSDVNNLTNVSYRRITEVSPQLNPNLPGMTLPRQIREWYVHPKTGEKHLLRMVEKTYVQGDLLSEEKVYDANGKYCYRVLFEYNNKRELVSEIDALGFKTIYKYDENGNKIYEEKVGSNKKTTYVYDLANRLIEERDDHDCGVMLASFHAYDAMSNKLSTTNHFGQTTTFQYDSAGREIASTDPIGQTNYKEFDVQGRITKEIDKDGFVTHTTHNLYGKPLEIIYSDGTLKRFAYNLAGHLVQEWERDGRNTIYEVDYKGRSTHLSTYSSDGILLKSAQKNYKGPNLISEIDPMGNITIYQYDGAGRKTAKLQGDQITTFSYDPLGRLEKTIAARTVRLKKYDYLDRVIEKRNEDLEGVIYKKTQYVYDINGNKVSKKKYKNADHYVEIKTIYNSESKPVAAIDALGNQTSFVYHYSDHLEKETINPKGIKEIEIYDELGRLKEVNKVSSEGTLLSHSSFVYNGRGHIVLQKEKILCKGEDLGGYEVCKAFDGMGQKTSEIEQNQKATSYTYECGKLYQIIKPDGVIIAHSYDSFGRLKELVSSEGTVHYRYEYDLNDNLIRVEDLVQNTTINRLYDDLNRLIFEKQATGFVINYTYDSLDRLIELQFQSEKIGYSYSPAGLKSAARYKDDILLYSFTQELDWMRKAICQTLPNGVQISYQWDDNFRCSKITSDLFDQGFHYDRVGNLIASQIRDPLGLYDEAFSYDELNQITQETGPLANQYAFDSLNNRRECNGKINSISELNQITSVDDVNYFYDEAGNRISTGDTRYSYDALGRLVSVASESGVITYKYDAFSRRTERHDARGVVKYLYQYDTEIGASVDGVITEFRAIVGQFSPFAIELEGRIFSPIRNHRGDICVVLNADGRNASTYRYDAFGNFTFFGSIQSPWLFSGQRYDNATKLYHFCKREYDSALGRWLTPDPLGFTDGANLYAYVHNNPLIYVDPYGLWGENLFGWNATKQFFGGFSRGFIDDTTCGASSYMLGEHNHSSLASKVGYYAGTGSSIAAGCVYGGTWLKGLRYGGIAAWNGYKFIRGVNTASTAARGIAETRSVVKLAQESKPLIKGFSDCINGTNKIATVKKSCLSSNGFFGKSGWELKNAKYQSIRNPSVKINDYNYSGHALDQMQNRGIVPSIVENTIRNGRIFPTRSGTIGYFDPVNKVRVVADAEAGKIITVIRGGLN